MLLLWLFFALGSLERRVLAQISGNYSSVEGNSEQDCCIELTQDTRLIILEIEIDNDYENQDSPPVELNYTNVTNHEVEVSANTTGFGQHFACAINTTVEGCIHHHEILDTNCSRYLIECTLKPTLSACQGNISQGSSRAQRLLEFSLRCCENNNCGNISTTCKTIFVEECDNEDMDTNGTTSGPPTVETPSGSPTVETPSGSPTVKAPSRSPTVEPPSGPPTVEAPSRSPTVETPSGPPTVEAPSRSPTVDAPSGPPTVETPSVSSTVAIVCGVIGSLIVVILAALLALQLIRMFRKKYHHTISGRSEINSTTLDNALYTQRPGEPSPYERAIVNGSGPQNIPLHPAQPSPYETATATTGVYSVLEPPDEKESSSQPGGGTEQHIYEDADRYVSSPVSVIANADYGVSLKTANGPNKSSQPPSNGDDYADPDDVLFDEEKYQTQPKTIKSAGGKNDRTAITTQYQPSDDNDYSIPDDAIEEKVIQPRAQESDEGILNPLYHELGKNAKETEPSDASSAGVTKAKPVTIESTMYEPAVSAPVPATAHSEPEPNTSTQVETESTSADQRAEDNSSGPEDQEKATPDPATQHNSSSDDLERTAEEHSRLSKSSENGPPSQQ